jgi:antitoxin CptB
MEQLMALADNDLLDLLLRRAEPAGDVDTPHAKRVLDMLRT